MAILAISPCKNSHGKVDQLDQLEVELCQLSQVGHAKNHSALSALFALLQVKVQKVQIVQCKNLFNHLSLGVEDVVIGAGMFARYPRNSGPLRSSWMISSAKV